MYIMFINFLSKCELQRRLAAASSGLVCTSMSSARQSTMWHGRLLACVRTDGRDFGHLLGQYERYLLVIWCDNLAFMWRLHIWRCKPTVCYNVQSTIRTHETRRLCICVCFKFPDV